MFEEIREILGSARRSIPFEEDFDRDVDIGARLVPFAGNLLLDSIDRYYSLMLDSFFFLRNLVIKELLILKDIQSDVINRSVTSYASSKEKRTERFRLHPNPFRARNPSKPRFFSPIGHTTAIDHPRHKYTKLVLRHRKRNQVSIPRSTVQTHTCAPVLG